MKARDFIREASALLEPRGQTHGDGWMLEAGALWTAYFEGRSIGDGQGNEITNKDIAICMALAKIARIRTGKFNKDNFVDAANYMALAGEYGFEEYAENETKKAESRSGTITGRWTAEDALQWSPQEAKKEDERPHSADPPNWNLRGAAQEASEVRTEDERDASTYRESLARLLTEVDTYFKVKEGRPQRWASIRNARHVLGHDRKG